MTIKVRTPKWVTQHALDRLLERWPVPPSKRAQTRLLCKALLQRVFRAMAAGDVYATPGGIFVPFVLFGAAGCAVMKTDRNIITVEEWDKCEHIAKMREEGMRAAS